MSANRDVSQRTVLKFTSLGNDREWECIKAGRQSMQFNVAEEEDYFLVLILQEV